jgi:hypothetical protein
MPNYHLEEKCGALEFSYLVGRVIAATCLGFLTPRKQRENETAPLLCNDNNRRNQPLILKRSIFTAIRLHPRCLLSQQFPYQLFAANSTLPRPVFEQRRPKNAVRIARLTKFHCCYKAGHLALVRVPKFLVTIRIGPKRPDVERRRIRALQGALAVHCLGHSTFISMDYDSY